MTVTVITGAASGMGRRCVESLRGSADHLVVVDLDEPRIEGTIGVACDISEIDLVGTALLLDAFEPIVEPNSAAVCFSSSSAYQLAMMGIDADLQALVSEPQAPGFLEAVTSRFNDSGLAYAWAKRGVIAVSARPRSGGVAKAEGSTLCRPA